MNVFNLLIGLALFVLGISYLIITYNKAKKNKDFSYMNYDTNVSLLFGVLFLIMCGVFLIYKQIEVFLT